MHCVFLVGLFCCFAAPIAQAQETAPPQSEFKPSAGRVQLIEDDNDGVLHVVIDGKEAARIDVDGLHVAGDINYSGAITDIGAAVKTEAPDAP